MKHWLLQISLENLPKYVMLLLDTIGDLRAHSHQTAEAHSKHKKLTTDIRSSQQTSEAHNKHQKLKTPRIIGTAEAQVRQQKQKTAEAQK